MPPRKNQRYYWNKTLQLKFKESKREISHRIEIAIQIHDLGKHTCLATDWCKGDIGFFLKDIANVQGQGNLIVLMVTGR